MVVHTGGSYRAVADTVVHISEGVNTVIDGLHGAACVSEYL